MMVANAVTMLPSVSLEITIMKHLTKCVSKWKIFNKEGRTMKKIRIFCMDALGRVVCGMMTTNEATATAYIERKQANGLLTIKTIVK